MADPATAGAAISGGADLAGGVLGTIGQGHANAKASAERGQLAGNLSDFISSNVLGDSLTNEQSAISKLMDQALTGGSYGTLEGQANRQLGRSSRALDASLVGRGIYDSGAALGAQQELRTGVIGGLADKINQDRLARTELASTIQRGGAQDLMSRLGLAGQLYSNDAFGNYDTKTGQATNQGK